MYSWQHADCCVASITPCSSSCPPALALLSPDVKELVPEFYYQPEFLRNSDGFDLGARQVSDGLASTARDASPQQRRLAPKCFFGNGRTSAAPAGGAHEERAMLSLEALSRCTPDWQSTYSTP